MNYLKSPFLEKGWFVNTLLFLFKIQTSPFPKKGKKPKTKIRTNLFHNIYLAK